MNIHQKRMYKLKIKITVGGTDNVPPMLCPPPAYAAACVPAHAKRIGRAGLNEIERMGCARPPMRNHPVLELGAAC
jgi:hypothetical protein